MYILVKHPTTGTVICFHMYIQNEHSTAKSIWHILLKEETYWVVGPHLNSYIFFQESEVLQTGVIATS